MRLPPGMTPTCPACGKAPVDPVHRPHADFCRSCWEDVNQPRRPEKAPGRAPEPTPCDLPDAAHERALRTYANHGRRIRRRDPDAE